MAKSARASAVKANRANLRRRIYGPVEEERTKRLSAKLAQVASQPKPEQPDKMDVEQDSAVPHHTSKKQKTTGADEMEIDHDSARQPTIRMKNSHKTPSRIQKPRRRKPQAQVVFPSLLKRKSSKHGKKGRK